MASTIKIKNSGVSSNVPSAGSLQYGELALNYADKRLYFKTGTSTVDYIASGGGGGGSTVTVSVSPPSSPSIGDLWFESETTRLFIYYDSYWVEASSPVASVGQFDGGTPSTNYGGIPSIDAGGV